MKNKYKSFAIITCFTLSMAACAGPVTMSPLGNPLEIQQETQKQKEFSYQKIIQDKDRVFNVSYPILAANAAFCGDATAPRTGMTAWNIHTVTDAYQVAARNIYNLQDRLAVQHVADGSPAAAAGIRSGDFIIAINGQEIIAGKNALKNAAEIVEAADYQPITFLLERNNKTIKARLTAVESCAAPVLLDSNSSNINAFTDGKNIIIEKGILRFVEDDSELALVIAHELGHISMQHVKKQQQNAMAGTIGGLAIDSILAAAGVNSGNQLGQIGQQIGATQNSVAFEQEADYVGMYFMERGGYNSSGVANFWRRMATEVPASVEFRGGSHPTSPERFIAIEQTHKEIIRKKAKGQALVPNFKQQ